MREETNTNAGIGHTDFTREGAEVASGGHARVGGISSTAGNTWSSDMRSGGGGRSADGARGRGSGDPVRDAFQKFDTDGNGVISLGELRAVLQRLPVPAGEQPFTNADFEQFLDLIDQNHDGVIDYHEFTDWISHDGEGAAEIMQALKTPKAQREVRGPERFFYDQSTYTGVHTRGGPSTIDSGGANQYSDLSEMTRPGLRGPGNSTYVCTAAPTSKSEPRSASPRPASASRAGHSASRGAPVGPERFYYDKSSYTGVHTHGGPSTTDAGENRHDLSEMTRPNLRAPQGSTHLTGQSSVKNRPSSRSASPRPGRLEATRPASSPGVRGPERFFYDKSSYTGTHTRGGPDHVAVGQGTSYDQSWKRKV